VLNIQDDALELGQLQRSSSVFGASDDFAAGTAPGAMGGFIAKASPLALSVAVFVWNCSHNFELILSAANETSGRRSRVHDRVRAGNAASQINPRHGRSYASTHF
jgi:hypothetical protein